MVDGWLNFCCKNSYNMTDMYRDYWGDYYTRSQNAFSLSLSLWLRRRFIVVVLLYHGLFLSLDTAQAKDGRYRRSHHCNSFSRCEYSNRKSGLLR